MDKIVELIKKLTSDKKLVKLGDAITVTLRAINDVCRDVLTQSGIEDVDLAMGEIEYEVSRRVYSMKFAMEGDEAGFDEFMRTTEPDYIVEEGNDHEIRYRSKSEIPNA